MNMVAQIAAYSSTLPQHMQREVLDFVQFLQQKKLQENVIEQKTQRQAGRNLGLHQMRDDFDAPLDDDFWLGQSK